MKSNVYSIKKIQNDTRWFYAMLSIIVEFSIINGNSHDFITERNIYIKSPYYSYHFDTKFVKIISLSWK